MSAVSRGVMPRSSALWTTARVSSRPMRPPKLLQPSPTSDTRRPDRPRFRYSMAHPAGSCFRAARECHGSRGAGTGPIPPDRFHRADSTGPIPPGRFRRSRYGRYGLLPVRPFPYPPRAMKIEAPFDQHRDIVRPEWIAYNGHMNVEYYITPFSTPTATISKIR